MTHSVTAVVNPRVEAVFGHLDKLVSGLDGPTSWRHLLGLHVQIGRRQAESAEAGFPCVDIPMLVHEAISGDPHGAVALAAACTFVYLGADLFDNLADDELPAEWADHRPAQISLVAATLLAPLPQLVLSGLPATTPPERLVRLSRVLAGTLLGMATGQHEDLLFSASSTVSVEECRQVSERKSGAELSGFARAAAILAGADQEHEEAAAAFAACWGTASQIASDLADLWDPDGSRDLLNGTRTLPIVHALTVTKGDDRLGLEHLLHLSRRSPEHHREVCAVLRAVGSVDYTMLVVQVYGRRAATALARVEAREPAKAELERLLARSLLIAAGS